MNNDSKYNKRIICVDDEDVMLETYSQVLGSNNADVFADILDDSKNEETDREICCGSLRTFDLILAKSGEEALTAIRHEMDEGRRVAAGFFDMRMPGGLDGYETILKARKIDPQMLCAVVTAYTDRSVEQIAELFTEKNQDELLYFNKPFRTAELRQTAVNMICSWNRKRNEEEQLRIIEKNRLGLQCILDAISDLMWIPPRSLQTMLSGILYQSLGLLDSEDGYISVLTEKDKMMIGHAVGKFMERENTVAPIEDETILKVIQEKKVLIKGRRCVIPLVFSESRLGLIDMESPRKIEKGVEKNILETFSSQMVPLILNSIFYDEIMNKEFQLLADPLTGLFNCRAISKVLQNEFSRSSRFSFSLTIILVEIENLQQVYEKNGQEAGNLLIKQIGQLLQQSIRKYDIVGRNVCPAPEESHHLLPCREGGFTIVLAQTDESEAKKVVDHIRQKLDRIEFIHDNIPVETCFTLGFGADQLNMGTVWDMECLKGIIDKAKRPAWVIDKKKPK